MSKGWETRTNAAFNQNDNNWLQQRVIFPIPCHDSKAHCQPLHALEGHHTLHPSHPWRAYVPLLSLLAALILWASSIF